LDSPKIGEYYIWIPGNSLIRITDVNSKKYGIEFTFLTGTHKDCGGAWDNDPSFYNYAKLSPLHNSPLYKVLND
jgi:hypothetical protein